MEYKIHNIDGLDVILVDIPNSKSTSIQFFVRAGSIFEGNNFSNGTAHFLEHMIFKGGKKYYNEKKFSLSLEKFGGDFNAATGKEYARYYINCPNENTKKSLEILTDLVANPNFDKKNFESEKTVIKQELSEKYDNNDNFWPYEAQKFLYGKNSFGNPVLGSYESLEKLELQELEKFYKKHYVRENGCLVVAGKLDKKILVWIEQYFKNIKNGKYIQMPIYNMKDYIFNKENKIGSYEKKSSQISMSIFFPGVFIKDKNKNLNQEFFNLRIGNMIFGGILNSRLFTNIRKKYGLCYFIGMENFETPMNTGMCEIFTGVSHENLNLAQEKIQKLVSDFSKKPFTKSEFEIAVGNKIGKLKMENYNASDIAYDYGSQYITNKKIDILDEYIKIYQKCNLENTNAAFEKIATQNNNAIFYIK